MMTNDDLCRSVYLLHLTTGLQSHKLAKLAGWSSRSITNSVKFSSPWSSAAKFCSEREGPRGTLEQREDRLRCSDNLERSFGCIFYLLCDCMNGLSQICVYRVPLKKSLAMGFVAIYIALLQPLHRQLDSHRAHIELTRGRNSLQIKTSFLSLSILLWQLGSSEANTWFTKWNQVKNVAAFGAHFSASVLRFSWVEEVGGGGFKTWAPSRSQSQFD